ncbi:OLC1v1016438C1 [Oldenlandia corymbosa var. corymbosa]|uniref:OLC1v1016438C1 n=1 Tax=Oldenlandia corymbosa var. corymbosa TaxID=529605 RepID=A0AAV1E5D5_OLDCO|nr:OLC1v1016438C1 [Oldenlandia corymbosa var. corymbosa]
MKKCGKHPLAETDLEVLWKAQSPNSAKQTSEVKGDKARVMEHRNDYPGKRKQRRRLNRMRGADLISRNLEKTSICHQWGRLGVDKVILSPSGLFIVRFSSLHARDEVLNSNAYHLGSKPIVVKPCKLASTLGVPVLTDEATASREGVQFARIMVEMEIQNQVPDKIRFEDENGKCRKWNKEHQVQGGVRGEIQNQVPDKIRFEDENGKVQEKVVSYEWKPVQCQCCNGTV